MRKARWIIILLILFVSCKKQQEYDYPLIFTGQVTNITSSGVTFSAKITDLSKYKVTDYGFVWDENPNPTIETSEKYIISDPPKIGVFSANITTTLRSGVLYYVRAFVRNSDYITYGKQVSFKSLGSMAPKVADFKPKTGNLKDTVMIIGHNFSFKPTNNTVKFGDFQATVVKAKLDTLWVLVPDKLNIQNAQVSVSIIGNIAIATDRYNLIAPVVTTFNDKIGSFGSQITITGKYFDANKASLQVYFDKYPAQIVSSNATSIVAIVPDSLNKRICNINVRMNNLIIPSVEQFSLAPITFTNITPKVAITGSTIVLTGNNFSPVAFNNIVTIGGLDATVIKASPNRIEVTLPLQNRGYYSSRNASVNVNVLGDSKDYNGTLLINDQWFRLKNSPLSVIPGSQYSYGYALANCFIANNKAYIGLNNKAEFWEYDPTNDSWKKLTDFPGIPRWYGSGFVINNKIYYGTGFGNNHDLKDWWEYNISTNTWTAKNDFAGEKRTGAVAFQIENIGYLGTGFVWSGYGTSDGYIDFWKYSSTDDSWTKITNYPTINNYFGTWWGISVPFNGSAYIGLGNYTISGDYMQRMYRYTPSGNTWEQIANFPLAGVNNQSLGFNLNNNLYIRTSYSKDFYYYDAGANRWIKVTTGILTDVNNGIAFAYNGKAYVGLGRENAMWEYDPSR